MSLEKSLSAALAALTLATGLLGSGGAAEARGYGGIAAAGVIGGLAFGALAAEAAAPRYGTVVEHRYVRKNGRLHYCGCVVRQVRYYR